MQCSFCNTIWDEIQGRQYCPNCGKLAVLVVQPPGPSIITIRQIIEMIIAGLLSYVILLFIFQKMNLPFTFEFYFGIDSSFVMGYRFYYLLFRTSNYYIRDFFPNYREFFILIGFLIWLIFFTLTTPFNSIFNGNTIDFVLIISSFTDFTVGYIIGIALIAYFFFRSIKRHRIRLAKQLINIES